jgi:tellurite resistance protein
VFGSIPQPAYMPCAECGASVPVGAPQEHVCSEERRLAFEVFKLRAELAAFDDQFAAYLESEHGRFELWYAERERRRKQR